jgi:hypothetical protein
MSAEIKLRVEDPLGVIGSACEQLGHYDRDLDSSSRAIRAACSGAPIAS